MSKFQTSKGYVVERLEETEHRGDWEPRTIVYDVGIKRQTETDSGDE